MRKRQPYAGLGGDRTYTRFRRKMTPDDRALFELGRRRPCVDGLARIFCAQRQRVAHQLKKAENRIVQARDTGNASRTEMVAGGGFVVEMRGYGHGGGPSNYARWKE